MLSMERSKSLTSSSVAFLLGKKSLRLLVEISAGEDGTG